MIAFSSGPVGIEPQHPDLVTQKTLWHKRFFANWLPYWKLDFPRGYKIVGKSFNSSVILLWLPGVLLNYFFYSPNVLCLSWLSLGPALVLLGVLWLMFRWIRADTVLTGAEKLMLCVTLGVPYVFMATTSNYVVYFNSFYYETASLIFLLVFMACLASPREADSGWRPLPFVWCVAALLLLTTAKASNLYWPLLALPFVMARFSTERRPVRLNKTAEKQKQFWRTDSKSGRGRSPPATFAIARTYLACQYAALVAVLTLAAFFYVRPPDTAIQQNAYNRLFAGVLPLSTDPAARLAELGLSDSAACVGQDAFKPQGVEFLKARGKRVSLRSALLVLWKEPAILFRMAKCAADKMQTLSIAYLGTRSADNPVCGVSRLSNLWGEAKSKFFPRGYALFGTLAAYAVLFLANIRSAGPRRVLASIGLLATIACFVDMNVVALGDGMWELTKHLFLANVLFDVASIAAVNVAFLLCVGLAKTTSSRLAACSVGGEAVSACR